MKFVHEKQQTEIQNITTRFLIKKKFDLRYITINHTDLYLRNIDLFQWLFFFAYNGSRDALYDQREYSVITLVLQRFFVNPLINIRKEA